MPSNVAQPAEGQPRASGNDDFSERDTQILRRDPFVLADRDFEHWIAAWSRSYARHTAHARQVLRAPCC